MSANMSAKFNFDTVFGEDGEVVRTIVRQRPKTSFTPDEVAALQQEAFAQGAQNAEAAANAALAEAFKGMSRRLDTLLRAQSMAIAELRAEMAGLAVAIARKVAGHAMARYPMDELEPAIAKVLHDYHDETRLVIRVAPTLCATVQARIDAIASEQGFAGRAIVAAEPALGGCDTRIEWADGGVERDISSIFATLEQEIQRWNAAETASVAADTNQGE
jgi:flagellar assembly protein FliH